MNSKEKCKCTMAISVLGSGCRYCQPQAYIDMLSERIEEDKAELDAMEKELEEWHALRDHKNYTWDKPLIVRNGNTTYYSYTIPYVKEFENE